MASLKSYFQNLIIPFFFSFSRSRTSQAFSMCLLTLALFFFFSASDNSPSINSANSLSSRLHFASIYISSLSSVISSNTQFVSSSPNTCPDAVTELSLAQKKSRKFGIEEEVITSCDIFDGNWILDDSNSYPLYKPGSCPFIDDSFNCFKNGRPDSDYMRLRWKPHGCHIPRFDGLKMLKLLRGKRVVFVEDSLNRNMWEPLICALRESLVDKSRVVEVSGRRKFRTQGFYSFRFKFIISDLEDYQCSIDLIESPFLVQEWKMSDKAGTRRETLRLDVIPGSYTKYQDADIIIFNTGHWWTHQKTYKGNNYFQEGSQVYTRLEVGDAYSRALRTWSKWVDSNINPSKTSVFFGGYSATHFKGGQWNSGGSCKGETRPIMNDTTHIATYPWMMSVLESVLEEMKTPVFYMNITKMTDYRKDGHPSIFRQVAEGGQRHNKGVIIQDCSHWCLRGVPDAWNELLYASLLMSHSGPV